MNKDTKNAVGASVLLSAAGVVHSGTAGLGFLIQPVPVPMWFILAAAREGREPPNGGNN